MSSKVGTAFLALVASIILLITFSLYREEEDESSRIDYYLLSLPLPSQSNALQQPPPERRHVTTVSVLLPAWQVLVIADDSPPPDPATNLSSSSCVFPTSNLSSPATTLPGFPHRTAFKCDLPPRLRRVPFLRPILTPATSRPTPEEEMPLWNYLAYESLTTEDDVILFVKGINNHHHHHATRLRHHHHLNCLFTNGVTTPVVLTAVQEVFRCPRPTNLTEFGGKITLQYLNPKQNATLVVPTVAHYNTPFLWGRTLAHVHKKELTICACTMVYNAAKFLKEWVTYHASIGVHKFVLYDNESDDNLSQVVRDLIDKDGFDISTLFWVWPKTQEAGFSHCTVMYNHTCTWMMFVDVDEFVYSPGWANRSRPSNQMLGSMVVRATRGGMVGQVKIGCYEFGPSDQREHPTEGVTQGYNCRRREANRHKSIVLLDAVDQSLHNVVHHFQLKPGYRSVQMRVGDAIVNHYKYQAWSEFKTKYRRRVSAYVVDWTRSVNLASKDRTPGLGVVPVEPDDWPQRFCQVYDNNLRDLTRLWFAHKSESQHYMAWQR